MIVFGGSGLDSGLLEPLALVSDVLGPPDLGSNLLEHRGYTLTPWNHLGFPGVDFLLSWILPSWGFLGPPGLDPGFWGLRGLDSELNDHATFRTSGSLPFPPVAS